MLWKIWTVSIVRQLSIKTAKYLIAQSMHAIVVILSAKALSRHHIPIFLETSWVNVYTGNGMNVFDKLYSYKNVTLQC